MQQLLSVLIVSIWLLLISYAVFTLVLQFLWKRLPAKFPNNVSADFISVIIPVRNEAENILQLLSDLNSQTFPSAQFEVLVMDDGSTDLTASIVQSCSVEFDIFIRLISIPDTPTTSPKKRAIETAIAQAKGNLILTTDGDCRVGTGWLAAFAACHSSSNAKLISGPVTFVEEEMVTDHLQTVEFSSLIGSGASAIAAGYPSLCNGANLAYEKSVFYEVNGYDGVRHIASGDDEFLMHKIAARYPDRIHFLKDPEAIVRTKPHKQWELFFRQRKRWASKWKHYQSKTPLILALYIFLCNFSFIATIILFLTNQIGAYNLGALIALKCLPEWLFLGSVLSFLGKRRSIFYIPLTQTFYPFYVCFFGLAAQKPQYEWKGRKLK
ncbi:glycosyltransferase [Dyadobacter psychrotolerans]|uniref:Glycosyltransferase n=1 Tax=Dyadobacter psychrotolerans TaxID=2541721 RepID=A0A4R5DSK3_9BACT|nr:glycosyltransferase [Dyadobacter psychrotolerans]TDE15334.1 glycosyltransferase [Dyadobacter psychrotolerans]